MHSFTKSLLLLLAVSATAASGQDSFAPFAPPPPQPFRPALEPQHYWPGDSLNEDVEFRPVHTDYAVRPVNHSTHPVMVEAAQPALNLSEQPVNLSSQPPVNYQAQRPACEHCGSTEPCDCESDGWFVDHQGRGDPQIHIVNQQTRKSGQTAEKKDSKSKKWYDKLSIRGYAQFRLNETLHEEPGSAPPQHVGDRSVGDDQNFLIRRARVIISGDVSDYLYVYLQPDFASNVPGSPDANHFVQIRDWYGDCHFDKDKVHRIRVGQSKIPYGWENMQSSSNRLPLDRNDALNSAVRNERDLGVFYYYTPDYAQDFFKAVLDEGLKGSGNYGMLGMGFYNGQGGSLQEQNDNMHFVTRLTLPFQLDSGQYMEAGVQGYTGEYTVLSSAISPLGIGAPARPLNTLETGNRDGIRDERIAGTFVWYPQPLGFQAEWNVGSGPGLNDAQTAVEERSLYGGYVMSMYRYETDCHGIVIPFVRYNHFRGGYKPERNAPFAYVSEWELGTEWQIRPEMEFTAMYTITDRTNTVAISEADRLSYGQFDGQLLRLQFQINY